MTPETEQEKVTIALEIALKTTHHKYVTVFHNPEISAEIYAHVVRMWRGTGNYTFVGIEKYPQAIKSYVGHRYRDGIFRRLSFKETAPYRLDYLIEFFPQLFALIGRRVHDPEAELFASYEMPYEQMKPQFIRENASKIFKATEKDEAVTRGVTIRFIAIKGRGFSGAPNGRTYDQTVKLFQEFVLDCWSPPRPADRPAKPSEVEYGYFQWTSPTDVTVARVRTDPVYAAFDVVR